MKRVAALGLILAGAAWPQQDKSAQKSRSAPQVQEQVPPEEDESVATKQYSFNPLEAQKDLQVGNYYFRKGDYKAAMSRFHEATLWNPTFAEAFLRLGESEDKLKNKQAAEQAYNKFLELSPTGKEAASVKKKLARER
ncbi:MAG TPA: tetratricopeptide repeat protein [Bryobacteraceae bacterium]|nr:tetratricopeptide repeat protein [Bryobacteraceae bacterium]